MGTHESAAVQTKVFVPAAAPPQKTCFQAFSKIDSRLFGTRPKKTVNLYDLCSRPTAEQLLEYSFFKYARNANYITTIIKRAKKEKLLQAGDTLSPIQSLLAPTFTTDGTDPDHSITPTGTSRVTVNSNASARS